MKKYIFLFLFSTNLVFATEELNFSGLTDSQKINVLSFIKSFIDLIDWENNLLTDQNKINLNFGNSNSEMDDREEFILLSPKNNQPSPKSNHDRKESFIKLAQEQIFNLKNKIIDFYDVLDEKEKLVCKKLIDTRLYIRWWKFNKLKFIIKKSSNLHERILYRKKLSSLVPIVIESMQNKELIPWELQLSH